jgi:hypothetical protein
MKKVVIVFGVISGLIMAGFVFLVTSLCSNGTISMDRGELVGYTAMVISLSMIFFGIKSYRDNYNGGKISFWKGMQIGLLITLIASFFYFGGAELYNVTNPGFYDKVMIKFAEMQTEKMKQAGAPQEEIDKAIKSGNEMLVLMKNPIIFYGICLMELSPVGIIITLISAAILRKKEFLPPAKLSPSEAV